MIAALGVALALFAGPAEATQSKCYGAAARDTERRCANPTKRVTPTPDAAAITPNVACVRGELADSCSYGAAQPTATVALLGDSHAAHWRAGLEVVAKARKWRVMEFARPHCPFSFSVPARSEAGSEGCVDFNRRVIDWLAANPDVGTIFISNNARLAMAEKGLVARVRGDQAALAALPGSVRQVNVLRDTPTRLLRTPDCISAAVRAGDAPGEACAISRRRALVPDATAIAAERMTYKNTRILDLTPFFCSSKLCFPVVGGVLVHKDQDHLTQEFARTLGPYIGRALDRAESS